MPRFEAPAGAVEVRGTVSFHAGRNHDFFDTLVRQVAHRNPDAMP